MEINLFEINRNELEKIEKFLENNDINESTLNELLKSVNFSFSIERCSRIITHVVCETLDSYTQQSQRYVKMGGEAFVVPKEIKGSEHEKEFIDLTKKLFEFYYEMNA